MEAATAKQALEAFCAHWFEHLDAEGAIALLSEDVDFIGATDHARAHGLAAMAQYVRESTATMREPLHYSLAILREQVITPEVSNISADLILRTSDCRWQMESLCTLVREMDGAWRIRSLLMAEPGGSGRDSEHYPSAVFLERPAAQRIELLKESLLGGMVGSYIAPGLPFYFINREMLRYLGYTDEADFVADIDGLIINDVHPDDREAVETSVNCQLRDSGQYSVEYRMRKRSGAYIWVHDLGRQITAENGRPAIVSVCLDITAQKTAQEEIIHLYNNIPGAVFRCRFDADFSVIDANDSLFDFLGYTREEFAAMGNRMSAVIYPADLAVMADKLRIQLEHGNAIRNENRLICKDGAMKWISIKAQLATEADGQQYFYCVFVDITEEKQLQARVQELYEKELAHFAQSAGSGSLQGRLNITRDRLESYSSSSETAVTQVGASYGEAVRSLAASALEEADRTRVLRTLDRETVLADFNAGQTEYQFEFLQRRNTGGAFWGRTCVRSCLNPETGDVIAFFYTLDVTEARIQEQLLSRIAELDYDVITDIDLNTGTHRLVSLNNARKNTVPRQGDFQKEIRAVARRFMDEDTRREYLEKLSFDYMERQLSEQGAYNFILEISDEAGERQVKRIQVFYISKALRRVCMARTDITDIVRRDQRQRERLAAALAAAEQANAAKSDFLSRMSHEIRTPMNAIIGMSAIAAQSIGDDEQVADCIAKIGISSRFLLSLINDILDMTRIESGKMLLKNENIPTEEFINGLNTICFAQAEAKGVEYECIVDPMLDDCYVGDAMKLQQVLLNILSNAIKFTAPGGRVSFSAEQRSHSKSRATLRFVINDTGVGIGEDFMPHLFEPFAQESVGATTQYGGTGLGLAISKNIVDLMDGKITVRSIKGIGSEFTVEIKLGITEDEHKRRKKQHEYNFARLKTLVVDDDVTVCESAILTLREIGIQGEWVDSGRKAIDRVREKLAQGQYFDMILIDWKMPEMDGLETARRIRALVGPEVTIIIITAYDWAVIEHEAKLAGVNLLISKPMFKSSLISAFSRALGEKEEQQPEPAPAYNFTGKRVLLAEDNAINTEVAVMLLTTKGFTVETAENGLRAMELFSRSPEGYYDAILMDIRMPLMDGLTAAANIRHLSNPDARTIPIIAMTANAFDDDIEKSKAAGMNAHLAKPIDPDRLYQTLHDFIFRKKD